MLVFFKNIPDNANHVEIKSLIAPAIKGGLLKKQGSLNRLDILVFKEKNTKITEYHALASIEPENAAIRVIKTLHGTFIKGNRIIVKEFQVRNPKNDRRKDTHKNVVSPFQEKRNYSDRRRDLETYKIAKPHFL